VDFARHLQHEFARPELLRRALTHPSLAGGGARSYERLEFLGDRVLGLVVAEMLFRRFAEEPEGDLAKRHAMLVRRETLALVARELDLGPLLELSPGEEDSGGRANPAILADACEAVFGALYLDGGIEAARRVIVEHWTALLELDATPPQDSKTALQEWAQARGLPLPAYRVAGQSGPPHDPRFVVQVAVEGQAAASGEGGSKRAAEQAAAGTLLARLQGAEE
jgi:ribonuclease-3